MERFTRDGVLSYSASCSGSQFGARINSSLDLSSRPHQHFHRPIPAQLTAILNGFGNVVTYVTYNTYVTYAMHATHVTPAQLTAILNDFRDFVGRVRWYSKRGVPYRRGYLLHGTPGSGKTHFTKVLAGRTG